MNRSDFRHVERLRVRWAEVDAQKVVFNGHYLMYFDTAISGYWRSLALPYEPTMAYLDGDLFVRKSTLEYHAPAHFDDLLQVGVRCGRIGSSSMLFTLGVYRGEDLLVSGELVYVHVDAASRLPQPVPQQLREVLQGFEAGKPMLDVRVGDWDTLGFDAQAIRRAVFIDEQRIPEDMEWDGSDPGCVHAVAYNLLGVPLATGRLLEHVPGVAKIGRMAVSLPLRGSQVGRAVLDALMDTARARGDREAVLHAQVSALAFYSRAGFIERGPRFDEAGIPHVEMMRKL
jgi:YbgC/YbaW family acyl-CoA thioester hydrolase